jgi:hypothetical protein
MLSCNPESSLASWSLVDSPAHQIKAMMFNYNKPLMILNRMSSVLTLTLRQGQMLLNVVWHVCRNAGENFWKSSKGSLEVKRALSNVAKYHILEAERMGGSRVRLLPPLGITALCPASVDDSASVVLAYWDGFLHRSGLSTVWATTFFVWPHFSWGTWVPGRGGSMSLVMSLDPETGVTSWKNDPR